MVQEDRWLEAIAVGLIDLENDQPVLYSTPLGIYAWLFRLLGELLHRFRNTAAIYCNQI